MAAKLWNKAPFIRLLLATSAGIVLQWYAQLSLMALIVAFGLSLLCVALYSFLGINTRFRLRRVNGAAINVLFSTAGGLLLWMNDLRNNSDWIGHHLQTGAYITATLQEPLVEKPNSYKALASIASIHHGDSKRPVKGDVILYFKKDSLLPPLGYGSHIVLSRPLQEIKNTGNPGSFDYKTWCLHQGITHQAFLAPEDYVVLPAMKKTAVKELIYQSRQWVVGTLKRNISGAKEQGLAEALLIGYKDDLDKNLVQAYSNTGVVHIIAISGLHLGLIYWLLLVLTRPLGRTRKLVWVRMMVIIACLWLFSLLAGAQPSVLRSAVMFTVIAVGEVALRRTNIFNTLACSAMILLCWNPFWLWDVGFQLSYAAVLSIVLFFQPVYNWFDFQNRLVDGMWKLTAVTISAQLLTLPISIYHFHQLPLLFLFTNFIAVPLSSIILFGEILLCAFFFLPSIASFIGSVLHRLIYWMNSYIEQLDHLPVAVWGSLSINVVQAVLLLIFTVAACHWLLEKQRGIARIALSSFALFMLLRAISFYEAYQQQKLIVYNVPKQTAIDIIDGRKYAFLGDTLLLYDEATRNFHLQPSRIMHRVTAMDADPGIKSFRLQDKQVVVMDESVPLVKADPKPRVDVLVLSKNPKLYISQLQNAFNLKQVVIDGSVPVWKAALWKRDCDSLRIPCYNVSDEGAFVMNW